MSRLSARVRAAVHDSSHSALKAPIRFAHRVVVQAQLAGVTAVDAVRYRRDAEPEWLADQLTICAKTFLRPATARRLVTSSRRVFSGRIVIADDSPDPMSSPDDHTVIVPLPFNSGVPTGRNAALARVETPYTLVTDDDAVFTKATDLAGVVGYLDANPDVDAVCARLIELPRWYAVGSDGALFAGAVTPLRVAGEVIDGLRVVLKGPQVYVGRTAALRTVPYDERIRMVEHRDFFSMASGRLVFVEDPGFVAFHARTPFNRTYTSYRNDVSADLRYVAVKWS